MYCDLFTSAHLYRIAGNLIKNYVQKAFASLTDDASFLYAGFPAFSSKKYCKKIPQPVLGDHRQWIKKTIVPVWHYARKQQNGFSFK